MAAPVAVEAPAVAAASPLHTPDGSDTRERHEESTRKHLLDAPSPFREQGCAMARPLRQLLAEGADPLSVRAAAVLHALQLPLNQFMGAVQGLRAPADAVQ